MMLYQKTDSSEEIINMDTKYEQKMTSRKDRCSRQTGILVLVGVCVIIFLTVTFGIFWHQQRKFLILESWMNSHISNLTSVKPDHQNAESLSSSLSDLKSSVSDLTSSVASISSQLSAAMPQQDVESLMNRLNFTVSSLTSTLNDAVKKQAETERSLDTLRSSLESDQQNKQRDLESLKSSMSDLKSSVSNLTLSVASLSSKQQTSGSSVVTCKSGWILYKSSCFLFSTDKLNWTDARDYCKGQGALLLKIQDDDEEWAFLNKRTIPTSYWVGLTDQTTGQWRWVDDTPYVMNKERWYPGQPDDWKDHGIGEGGEDCGHITYSGKLNDSHCSAKMKFICRVQY